MMYFIQIYISPLKFSVKILKLVHYFLAVRGNLQLGEGNCVPSAHLLRNSLFMSVVFNYSSAF